MGKISGVMKGDDEFKIIAIGRGVREKLTRVNSMTTEQWYSCIQRSLGETYSQERTAVRRASTQETQTAADNGT